MQTVLQPDNALQRGGEKGSDTRHSVNMQKPNFTIVEGGHVVDILDRRVLFTIYYKVFFGFPSPHAYTASWLFMRFLPGQLQSIVFVYNQHAEREDVHPVIVAKYLKSVVAFLLLHNTGSLRFKLSIILVHHIVL